MGLDLGVSGVPHFSPLPLGFLPCVTPLHGSWSSQTGRALEPRAVLLKLRMGGLLSVLMENPETGCRESPHSQ